MKKLSILLALLTLLYVGSFSQRIYFCANYTASGEPISTGTVWNITAEGGYIYILYQQGSSEMPNTINFYINK